MPKRLLGSLVSSSQACAVLAGTLMLLPLVAVAQVPVIPDEPSCPECTIEVTALARLGDINDPTSPSGGPLAIGPAGSFYVAAIERGRILVYGPDGGPLVRTIGRFGQGPGEFGEPDRMFFWADSLFVFDRMTARLSVFDPIRWGSSDH